MSSPQIDALPAELRRKFAALRQWQVMTRFVTVLAVLVLGGMFYVFATRTPTGVKANFQDAARVEAAVNKATPEITPLAYNSIRTIVADAAPTYQKIISERYPRVRDNLGSTAIIRLQKLPDEGGKLMGLRLSESFDRVITRIKPELDQTFPSLTDAQRRDLIVDHFAKAVAAANERLAAKVDAVRVNESSRVLAVLEKFALPAEANTTSEEQLRKELTRVLSLLVQEYLDKADLGGEATAIGAADRAGPATQPSPR
jgi:hypothetical protein